MSCEAPRPRIFLARKFSGNTRLGHGVAVGPYALTHSGQPEGRNSRGKEKRYRRVPLVPWFASVFK